MPNYVEYSYFLALTCLILSGAAAFLTYELTRKNSYLGYFLIAISIGSLAVSIRLLVNILNWCLQ